MNRFKQIFIIGSLLALTGGLFGCDNQQNTQSQELKVTHHKKKAQKKQPKRNEAQATISSNEQDSMSETTETTNEGSMNFAQIKQGNYNSLLGSQWTQVAAYLNKQDGQGYVWTTDNSSSLNVTQNEIMYGNISIQGNSLIDPNEEEGRTLTFRENEGALFAQSNDTGVIWNLGFYPAGVAMEAKEWRPGMPETIDTNQARLTIRSSVTGYLAVFQKNDGSEESQPATKDQEAMNFEKIKGGNYDGLTGSWQNGEGKQLTIQNNQIDFSDVDNHGHAGQLTGLKLNIPAKNDSTGQPKDIPDFDETAPAYQQEMSAENDTTGILSLCSNVPGAVIYISFLQEGVAGDLQDLSQSELQQEKIIAVETQNNATAVPKEQVYYLVK